MLNIKKILKNIINNRYKYKNVKYDKTCFIDANTNIGEYTYIGSDCKITKSDIGRFCSIAPNVLIGLGEHKLDNISTSTLFYEGNIYEELTVKKVKIGNDVWIGAGSIILRGVTIGDGAVIGANSVVTKNVPDYSIVIGAPAKVIKYRFDEETIIKIKKTKWWQYDLEEAKLIHRMLKVK